jgi:hypothetical protein
MTTDIEKINDIIWNFLVRDVNSLGEVILEPAKFDKPTRTNKLGYADSTILLIDNLAMSHVGVDPLLSDGRALLNFLYNAVNINKYDDAKWLISDTSLWKIVRYTSPVADITIFPDEAVPILKDFLIKEFKK